MDSIDPSHRYPHLAEVLGRNRRDLLDIARDIARRGVAAGAPDPRNADAYFKALDEACRTVLATFGDVVPA